MFEGIPHTTDGESMNRFRIVIWAESSVVTRYAVVEVKRAKSVKLRAIMGG